MQHSANAKVKNPISIEEISRLKKKVSLKTLVYSKHKLYWLFPTWRDPYFIFAILTFSAICCVLLWKLPKFSDYKIWGLGFEIILFVLLAFSLIYVGKLERECGNGAMMKISQGIVRENLKGKIDLTSENLLFIIDCLRKDLETNSYSYSLLRNVATIIVGAYLGITMNGIVNHTTGFNEYFIEPLAISIIFLSVAFMTDYIFVKPFVIRKNKDRYELIRVFENIYLETINNKS